MGCIRGSLNSTFCSLGTTCNDPNKVSFVGNGRGDYVMETTFRYVGIDSNDYRRDGRKLNCTGCVMGCGCLCVLLLFATAGLVLTSPRFQPVLEKSGLDPSIQKSLRGVANQAQAWLCDYLAVGCIEEAQETESREQDRLAKLIFPKHAMPPATQAPEHTTIASAVPDIIEVPDRKPRAHNWHLLPAIRASRPTKAPIETLTFKAPVAQLPAAMSKDSPGEAKSAKHSRAPEDIAKFNCNQGLSNWKEGWSPEKKTWCCEHEVKGCEPKLLSSAEADKLGFDCVKDHGKWKTAWSFAKKAWCCQHKSTGCWEVKPGPEGPQDEVP